jgi:hypothetical protein
MLGALAIPLGFLLLWRRTRSVLWLTIGQAAIALASLAPLALTRLPVPVGRRGGVGRRHGGGGRAAEDQGMRTVADPVVLRSVRARLEALEPGSRRRWGTLTPHEMLCHLGDAAAMVLRTRPRALPLAPRSRPVLKFFVLWSPVRWPRGWATNPMQDPKAGGTRPSTFAADLDRAIGGLEGIASAGAGTLEPVHGLFGTMSVADWQRWAYKHTDHHLRQFGG